jgi:hypothetical protein
MYRAALPQLSGDVFLTDSAYYGVNCAHPIHFAAALPGGAIGGRLRSLRANASEPTPPS